MLFRSFINQDFGDFFYDLAKLVGISIFIAQIAQFMFQKRMRNNMSFILTDAPDTVPEDSPLRNIFDHAFPIADKLSIAINDSVIEMAEEGTVTKSMSDAIIIHTISLMIIICMMNREVLEDDTMDSTLKTVKNVTGEYIKHLTGLGGKH